MFFKQFFGVEFPTDLKTGLHQTGRSNHHPLIYFLKVYFMVYRNKQSQCVQLRVFVQDPCPSSHGIALMMNGQIINEAYVKYLGHYICANMKDDMDIMRQCRQLYAQGNVLAHRFHMCTDNEKITLLGHSMSIQQMFSTDPLRLF